MPKIIISAASNGAFIPSIADKRAVNKKMAQR